MVWQHIIGDKLLFNIFCIIICSCYNVYIIKVTILFVGIYRRAPFTHINDNNNNNN